MANDWGDVIKKKNSRVYQHLALFHVTVMVSVAQLNSVLVMRMFAIGNIDRIEHLQLSAGMFE